MRLVSFSVENFRSIVKCDNLQISQKSVLIYSNKKGKPNLLRAIDELPLPAPWGTLTEFFYTASILAYGSLPESEGEMRTALAVSLIVCVVSNIYRHAQALAQPRAVGSRDTLLIIESVWHQVEQPLAVAHSPEQIAAQPHLSAISICRHIVRDKAAGGML
jgi:hypothetical protein